MEHKINHLKVYNSMALSTFTKLCNEHLFLVPKRFIPKAKPVRIKQALPLLSPSGSWQLPVCFLSLWRQAFCDWLLSLSIMFSIFTLSCNMYPYFIPFELKQIIVPGCYLLQHSQ